MRKSKQIHREASVEVPPSPQADRRRLRGMLLISLVLTALFVLPSGSAQRAPQDPATTTAAARNAALIAATQEVLKETSDLRQLSIIRPVQSSMQTRAEIERAVMKNLDEEVTPADFHASEVILKKLGLAPPDFQYRALMIRLLTEQVAGYYEPRTRRFHLADWIDIDSQKPVIAHELAHALQDQHFNLRRFERWPKGDSDAELAAHALIEGDATLAMTMYVAANPLRALGFLKSILASDIATQEFDKAPRALRETLLFPYQEGMIWARALYKQGGWAEVSKAFSTLPQSTEQVLHADKYFAREAPVKVVLPDVTNLLNAGVKSPESGDLKADSRPPTPASSGTWRRLASDVNGEWGFYLILDHFLKSQAESRRAAAGWGGDKTAVYENAKGEVFYISLSVWDSENDAREFFDAYIRRTQLRYPAATVATDTDQAKSDTREFRTSEGTVRVELHRSRVLIVEGVSDGLTTGAVLNAMRQTN